MPIDAIRSSAQVAQTVVSIGLPTGINFAFKETILPELTAANPTIQYRIVDINWPQTAFTDTANLEKYDQSLQVAARSADILLTERSMVNVYGSRAGYFLDLKPLLTSDAAFKQSDFLPEAWQGYQWDGGQWAMPISYGLVFFTYDAAAFDTNAVNYPNASWTFGDLANAARKLAVRVGEKVTVPGLYVDDYWLPGLFRAFSGETFSEAGSSPTTSRLSTPALAQIIETWAQLEREGVVTNRPTPDQRYKIPLQMSNVSALREPVSESGGDTRTLAGAPLPANTAIMDVYGLAISRGTAHPDQAYQTIKTLMALPGINLFGGTRSVRVDATESYYGLVVSEKNRSFLANLTLKAKAANNLLFGDYLRTAIDQVKAGLNGLDALGKADINAAQMIKVAEGKKERVNLVVDNPTPDTLNSGKQPLKFTLFTGDGSGNPQIADWRKVAEEFAAADPQIGKVDLQDFTPTTPDWGTRLQLIFDTADCAYMNAVGPEYFPDKLLPLDDLLTIDPSFNAADFPAQMLTDLKRNDHLMAYPIAYHPSVIRYDIKAFARLGIPLPQDGWTITQFLETLKALKVDSGEKAPFYTYIDNQNTLFSLIAAFGALPIDTRVSPPVIDYTSPKVIDAIRQTLDLTKSGYMETMKSTAFSIELKLPTTYRMYADNLLSLPGFVTEKNTFGTVTLPVGSNYTPITYSLNMAMIGAKTAFPDACYRWIRTIAQHAELFDGYPASAAVLHDAHTDAVRGKISVQNAVTYLQHLTAPNAVILDTTFFKGIGGAQLWLFRAFDNYVLNGKNLESELADAEKFTKGYLACVEMEGNSHPDITLGAIYLDDNCAKKIDPTIMSIFTSS